MAVIAVPSATAAVGTDSTALRNAVTVGAIKAHNAQFQTFVNASTAEFGHPTRVDGSVGFTRSVDYVGTQMRSYGYDVTVHEFEFDRFEETADPVFARTAPNPKTYVEESDFATVEYSGNGDVTAQVVPTNDIVLPSPGGSTSGCEASDFPARSSARSRGSCTFRQKAENAQAAGAIGVVIFNEGDTRGAERRPLRHARPAADDAARNRDVDRSRTGAGSRPAAPTARWSSAPT